MMPSCSTEGSIMRRYLATPPVRAIAMIGTLILGAAVSGCASGSSKSSSTVPSSTTPSSTIPSTTIAAITTPTTSAPSAVDDLTGYFAAAANDDHLLKMAAEAVNAAIGKTQITIEQSTLDAIEAANPSPAAKEIPGGLTEGVLLPVLTVQSDLVSRYFSLRGLRINLAFSGRPGTFPITDPQVRNALGCLGEGATAAASFATDVATARTAAVGAPRLVAVDPASRAAAELAVRLAHMVGSNSGGLGCGGSRVTSLVPITWNNTPPVKGDTASWDGAVKGVAFTSTYKAGQGWTVQIYAN
jgi:hypothetical protein